MYLIFFLQMLLNPLAVIDANTEPERLYISQDNGKSWHSFTEGLPQDVRTRDIVEHDCYLYMTTSQNGLYRRKTAAGSKWEAYGSGLEAPRYLSALAINGKNMAVGTAEQGVYISSNGGKDWRRPVINLNGFIIGLYYFGNTLTATTEFGIFESINYGQSWQKLGNIKGAIYLVEHQGKRYVSRQNSMGIIDGDQASWFDVRTEWAIGDLVSTGEYLYIRSSKDEVYRSKDGSEWEKSLNMDFGGEYSNLSEALWGGMRVPIPKDTNAGQFKVTSMGWLVAPNDGC